MSDQPAAESPFAIRWRLFGTRFCIRPSFWLVAALWGYFVAVRWNPRGSASPFTYIAMWVFCTLVSVLIHELGHVIMGRIFGEPGDITLAGMGGQASGKYENLNPWRRMLIAFSGPGAGFLFLGFMVLLDYNQWNLRIVEWFGLNIRSPWCIMVHFNVQLRSNPIYFDIMFFLFLMNLFWNLINLIPIMPMDGGMIFKDICCLISPEGGVKFAYAWSLLLAGTLALYYLLIMIVGYYQIRLPFPLPTFMIFPLLGAIMFGMMAWQAFQALRTITTVQRRSQYEDTFND